MRKYAATASNKRLTIEIIIRYSIPLEYYMDITEVLNLRMGI
jgi:hypothetical protein